MLQRSPTAVVYCTIDELISNMSRPVSGFFEFLDALEEQGVPCVWVTSRTRLQIDTAIRKVGQSSPFIAEGGAGVYLPEDYFHLKPSRSTRFARFTCIPVAVPQPAAEDALDQLAVDSKVEVVPLRTLSPRELSQNAGVPQREAELLRQRDFDEFFFFAGATEEEIAEFKVEASRRKLQLRGRGNNLWSLAVGASVVACIRELSGLYERSFRTRPYNIALAAGEDAEELFSSCNRAIFLMERNHESPPPTAATALELPLSDPGTWERALEAILAKRQ